MWHVIHAGLFARALFASSAGLAAAYRFVNRRADWRSPLRARGSRESPPPGPAAIRDDEAAADLVGFYSHREGGKPTYRISRRGAHLFWSHDDGGRWTPATRAVVVCGLELNELARKSGADAVTAGLRVKGKSASEGIDFIKVPIGWRFRRFRSATGYVLFSWFGPSDLHKVRG